MEKLSFVIPCYGSEHTLRAVVEEIRRTMEQSGGYDYEIILVNDDSPDEVWNLIKELAGEYKQITGISLAKNFGQHAALMAGYAFAGGDIMISLDDDGQTPADECLLLVDKIHEGFDVVYGTYDHIQQNAFRKFGSFMNEKMSELMLGKPRGLKTTSYYAARKFIIKEMLRYHNPFTYVGGLVFRSTHNIGNVPVHHRKREIGHSGYSFSKLLGLWFNGFTAFSVKPLRVATFIGLLFSLGGFGFALYTVINKLIRTDIDAGWSSLMAAIMVVGGMILFMLGLVGEYIGRIYISINDAPQYVIRETVHDEK